MAINFGGFPYQPLDLQGTKEVYQDIGADLGTAYKQIEEKYGIVNVAYNKFIAQNKGKDTPPLNVWKDSDVGKQYINQVKMERKARFAQTPFGSRLLENVGPREYKDMLDEDAFASAMGAYGQTEVDISGWSDASGFNPFAYKPGAGFQGQTIRPESLAALQDQDWYKQYIKEAEMGEWQPGGKQYEKYAPKNMSGVQKVLLQVGGGGQPDIMKEYLRDFYTTPGLSGDEYRYKNPLAAIFGSKKDEEAQAPPGNVWEWAQQKLKNQQGSSQQGSFGPGNITTTNAKQNKKGSNIPFNLLNYVNNDPTKNVSGFSAGPFNMNQQSPQTPVSQNVLKQLWEKFNKLKGGQ